MSWDAQVRIAPRATSNERGYVVLARNWRCREGELDLVVAIGARPGRGRGEDPARRRFGHPFEAIDARKQSRLWRLAMAWIAANPEACTGPLAAHRRDRDHRARPGDRQTSSTSSTWMPVTLARTWAVALSGLEGALVEVEADLSNQQPDFKIIGLPDKALGEAVQRVHNACANSGLALPRRRLTVNLSPASLPKQGAGFDVAIAIAALATEAPMDAASVAATVHLGELGLDGRLRPVPGVLPAVVAAAQAGIRRVVVPWANRDEAELVDGMTVLGAVNLAEVARWHGAGRRGRRSRSPSQGPGATRRCQNRTATSARSSASARRSRLSSSPRRAATTCSCAGPPGAGKTMLARRLPGHPPRPRRSRRAGDRIHPLARRRAGRRSFRARRPSRRRTIRASMAALVGGGYASVRPGCDREGERRHPVPRRGGRVPGERRSTRFGSRSSSGSIIIHRAGATAAVPRAVPARPRHQSRARAATTASAGGTCTCPPMSIRRYLGRLSGPLLDRIDIELALARVSVAHARRGRRGAACRRPSPASACRRGAGARRATAARNAVDRQRAGARAPGCARGRSRPPPNVRRPLDAALHRGSLTLRGYDRVLRVAWSSPTWPAATSSALDARRPRALPQEGDHSMTDFRPSRDEIAAAPATLPARTGCRRASVELYARVVWSHLTEPGDAAAGLLIAELGAGGGARRRRARRCGRRRRRARAEASFRRRGSAGCRGSQRDAVRGVARDRGADAGCSCSRRPTRSGRPARRSRRSRPACPVGARRRVGRPPRLQPSVALVGARAATSYGDHVAIDLVRRSRAHRASPSSPAGVRHRRRRAPRGARRRRRHRRAPRGWRRSRVSGRARRPHRADHRIRCAWSARCRCGSAPTKWRFLQRNRLIAALADATVVVEAGWRSGSLNTAAHAAALGRPLGAVPGPITSAASAGTHRLLREFGAQCITSAADVRELLGARRPSRCGHGARAMPIGPAPTTRRACAMR